jgi:hypothetical protein
LPRNEPRKKALTSAAGSKKATRVKPSAKATIAELEAAPMPEVVLRLVREAVFGRIRHRALLAVLEDREGLRFDEFERRFNELLERDGDALFARLMLSEEDFRKVFPAWIVDDVARYVPKRSRVRAVKSK